MVAVVAVGGRPGLGGIVEGLWGRAAPLAGTARAGLAAFGPDTSGNGGGGGDGGDGGGGGDGDGDGDDGDDGDGV